MNKLCSQFDSLFLFVSAKEGKKVREKIRKLALEVEVDNFDDELEMVSINSDIHIFMIIETQILNLKCLIFFFFHKELMAFDLTITWGWQEINSFILLNFVASLHKVDSLSDKVEEQKQLHVTSFIGMNILN